MAFVFGLQTLQSMNFSRIYQLKGLKPKTKGHMNFYECCDLTEKVYLKYTYCTIVSGLGKWKLHLKAHIILLLLQLRHHTSPGWRDAHAKNRFFSYMQNHPRWFEWHHHLLHPYYLPESSKPEAVTKMARWPH